MDYYKYYYSSPIIQNSSSTTSSIINGDNIIPTVKQIKRSNKRSTANNNKRSPPSVMRLSTDPQSVAARERRHRISDRFKILQSLVPGGTKRDTVSMLDEAIHHVKFLKTQINWFHQNMMNVNVFYRDDVIVDRAVIPDHHHHEYLYQAQGSATTSYGYLNYYNNI